MCVRRGAAMGRTWGRMDRHAGSWRGASKHTPMHTHTHTLSLSSYIHAAHSSRGRMETTDSAVACPIGTAPSMAGLNIYTHTRFVSFCHTHTHTRTHAHACRTQVLALATDLSDMRERLGRMVIGNDTQGEGQRQRPHVCVCVRAYVCV